MSQLSLGFSDTCWSPSEKPGRGSRPFPQAESSPVSQGADQQHLPAEAQPLCADEHTLGEQARAAPPFPGEPPLL